MIHHRLRPEVGTRRHNLRLHRRIPRGSYRSNLRRHRRHHRFELDRNQRRQRRSCTQVLYLGKGLVLYQKHCRHIHLCHDLPIELGFLQGRKVKVDHGRRRHRLSILGNRCMKCRFRGGSHLRLCQWGCRHSRRRLGQTIE